MRSSHSTATAGVAAASVRSTWTASQNDAAQRSSDSNSGTRAPPAARLSAARIAPLLHGIRGDQGAHDGIRACQSLPYHGLVAIEFGLIVGEDHNRTPRITTAFAADVVGRIDHGAGDISATIKSLLAKQAIELSLHILTTAT